MAGADGAAAMRRYHERVKHSLAALAASPHYLDWDNQPDPFRRYDGAPLVALDRRPSLPNVGTLATLARLGEPAADGAPAIDHALVSALLWHSVAISAWKRLKDERGEPWSLRVDPSSGNLHPTETWLATPGAPDLPPALWHYRADVHALERRADGDFRGALAGAHGTFALVVVLASVLWREAWKYRERAYRYCLHDSGHVAGSIATAARALGLDATVIGWFADAASKQRLGLAGSDEEPLLVLGLGRRAGGAPVAPEPSAPRFSGVANAVSAETIEYRAIAEIHAASSVAGGPCPAPAARPTERRTPDLVLPPDAARDDALAIVARRRRSALGFDPAARMPLAEFAALLAHADPPWRADFRGNAERGPPRRSIRLVAYVHRVDGVEPGVWLHAPEERGLVKMKPGDVRTWAASLSLGQEIGADCAVQFSMIGDFEGAAHAFGDRGYRFLHAEAGFIGQCLYLGAEALGWNATGIGAFFDDDVHRFLGMTPADGQVIYHFAVGRAVADDRIVQFATEPLPFPA